MKKSTRLQELKHYLQSELDSSNPRENLDGVFTEDIVDWLEKVKGEKYSSAIVIKALCELIDVGLHENGYPTKDGVFSCADQKLHGDAHRGISRYIWFFS